MCGIAGIFGTLDPEGQDIAAMLRALAHRGPDGEGIHRESGAVLGHRRLSIIDLEGGRQPLRNAEGTIWLVCNGEIYNYVELRQQLEARGHRFVTHSDCEVIIGLYEAYGDRLLEHLRGMFAFALWDSRKQRLLAARDHLGQKPFFYVAQPQRFAFGSEIKAPARARPQSSPLESRRIGSVPGAAHHCAAAHDVPRRREAAAGPSAHSREGRRSPGACVLGP